MKNYFNPSNWFSKKVQLKSEPSKNGGARAKARQVIKAQTRREVSYQIEDIKRALNLATNPETPDRSKLFSIYNYIKRDARVKKLIRGLELKVVGEPWMLYNENEEPDEELTKQFRKRWFNTIIKYIALSEVWGYYVIELEVDTVNNTVKVEAIPHEHIAIEKQWILIEGNINGAYLPYGEIAWEIDLLEFGSKDDFGLLLEASYNVIWKFYARSDWSRANEKVGMPILSIIADTHDDAELDRLEDRAANFGSDGYIVGQKGDEFTLLERKGDNMHITFLEKIKLCNEENTLLFDSQTATTDQKAFVGAAEVQERSFEDLTLWRLQNAVDEMNEKVVPYLRHKGFAIPEGYTFNYPAVIRERDRKLKGQDTATDPVEEPEEKDPAKPKPNPKAKKKP